MTAELDAEAKAARVRRAREVIDGAGWLFTEYMQSLQGEWVNSGPRAVRKREALYARLRAAIEIKAILVAILQEAENDEVLREHKR